MMKVMMVLMFIINSFDVDGNADDDDKMTMVMVLTIMMKAMMAKMIKKMQPAEPTGRWEL